MAGNAYEKCVKDYVHLAGNENVNKDSITKLAQETVLNNISLHGQDYKSSILQTKLKTPIITMKKKTRR
jgi:hypothetical protein